MVYRDAVVLRRDANGGMDGRTEPQGFAYDEVEVAQVLDRVPEGFWGGVVEP